ncbi:HNH endonuclease signature motif containing protein [Halomonas sp. SSL-5]|uniref:HNH endonuclease signature motif containing protein n=1 Tax=Halomonas sp. SSL-5 TaxID=3065855 RepID=UPI0027392B38|nr:HNH endonuclease signature motif containing protein [Halomonas sp. SSL-5]MDY7116588.1 HNH endonuclease signature motif containing protein [Halomonas sp. SSL-5]
MKTRKLPAFQDLRVQFDYDEEAGQLYLRDAGLRRGRKVGGVIRQGNCEYLIVSVKHPSGKAVGAFAHRVIWKLVTGQEPPDQIDHFDGNGLNNRWENLRDGTNAVNAKNMRMNKGNSTGHNGVRKKRGKWVALDGKGRPLGSFSDIQAASRVARESRLKTGFTERHGIPEA